VADDKIRRMIKGGTLRAFRVGKRTWRIDQSELDRLRAAAPEKYPNKKR
jgi:excisionase family DNA binding protein